MDQNEQQGIDARDGARQRRRRSIAIALALGGLVILFFVMSIVRLHATFS